MTLRLNRTQLGKERRKKERKKKGDVSHAGQGMRANFAVTRIRRELLMKNRLILVMLVDGEVGEGREEVVRCNNNRMCDGTKCNSPFILPVPAFFARASLLLKLRLQLQLEPNAASQPAPASASASLRQPKRGPNTADYCHIEYQMSTTTLDYYSLHLYSYNFYFYLHLYLCF